MRVGSNIIIGEVRSSEGRKKRERKGYKTKHGIEREIERERGEEGLRKHLRQRHSASVL